MTARSDYHHNGKFVRWKKNEARTLQEDLTAPLIRLITTRCSVYERIERLPDLNSLNGKMAAALWAAADPGLGSNEIRSQIAVAVFGEEALFVDNGYTISVFWEFGEMSTDG